MTMENVMSRRRRKEEGKLKKRQRIEEAGGIRPRPKKASKTDESLVKRENTEKGNKFSSGGSSKTQDGTERNQRMRPFVQTNHRFGRVMESVPCRNKPRFSTVSIKGRGVGLRVGCTVG